MKNIIAKRCDHGGMRWIKERVEAIVQLRCIEANGDFARFADFVSARLNAVAQDHAVICRLQTDSLGRRPLRILRGGVTWGDLHPVELLRERLGDAKIQRGAGCGQRPRGASPSGRQAKPCPGAEEALAPKVAEAGRFRRWRTSRERLSRVAAVGLLAEGPSPARGRAASRGVRGARGSCGPPAPPRSPRRRASARSRVRRRGSSRRRRA